MRDTEVDPSSGAAVPELHTCSTWRLRRGAYLIAVAFLSKRDPVLRIRPQGTVGAPDKGGMSTELWPDGGSVAGCGAMTAVSVSTY